MAAQPLLKRADVVLTQQVRNDYRRLPIGTSQILSLVNARSKVITYPSMFYRGLHPYLVYVHATGELGTPAPLTEGYHDLRFIAEASNRGTAVATPHALQREADASLNELRQREKGLDVQIADHVASLGAESFWTINHPCNRLLEVAAAQVCSILKVNRPARVHPEILTNVVVPVPDAVTNALGHHASQSSYWTINGTLIPDAEVRMAHLAYYRERPDVLEVALEEHAEALQRLGLIESE